MDWRERVFGISVPGEERIPVGGGFYHEDSTIDEIREDIQRTQLKEGLNWIYVHDSIPKLQLSFASAVDLARYIKEHEEELHLFKFHSLLDGKDYTVDEMLLKGALPTGGESKAIGKAFYKTVVVDPGLSGQIKYPEPPEGWEARKPPEEWEVVLIRTPLWDIGKREQEIIQKVESIAYPIIREESKHLGIAPPRIEWLSSILVKGKEHRGAYHHGAGEREIWLNTQTITAMLEREKTEQAIITRVVRSTLHEFSHYIDDVYHKLSIGEVVKNFKYYETRANEYAEHLMPQEEASRRYRIVVRLLDGLEEHIVEAPDVSGATELLARKLDMSSTELLSILDSIEVWNTKENKWEKHRPWWEEEKPYEWELEAQLCGVGCAVFLQGMSDKLKAFNEDPYR